jgi:hypothetical protein
MQKTNAMQISLNILHLDLYTIYGQKLISKKKCKNKIINIGIKNKLSKQYNLGGIMP